MSAVSASDRYDCFVLEQSFETGSARTLLAVGHHSGVAGTAEGFFAQTALKVLPTH